MGNINGNIVINNTNIDGSGKVGINARESNGIVIDNSSIINNRDFAFLFSECSSISIKETLIEDNGEIMSNEERNVEMIENTLKGNAGWNGRRPTIGRIW